jgi:hypothetical protein
MPMKKSMSTLANEKLETKRTRSKYEGELMQKLQVHPPPLRHEQEPKNETTQHL